ncbi:hypothetical protein, partial [Demequina gelatinilytica]|uniref:hypothetical protein n=1 Tax=Demequina gelatinilytica TaxID=1638980 RepID=UPI001E427606
MLSRVADARLRAPGIIAGALLALLFSSVLVALPAYAADVEPVVTVTPTEDVTDGDTLTVTGTLPAQIDGADTSIYVMYCATTGGEIGT